MRKKIMVGIIVCMMLFTVLSSLSTIAVSVFKDTPKGNGDFNRSLIWEGIGPYGSTITAITYHPTVNKLVYLGTQEHGLYYSLDNGLTWTNIYSDGGWIEFIIIDPFSPSTLLVGASGYLRRSTDWGQTWNEIFSQGWFNAGTFDPAQPGVAYISLMGSPDFRSVALVYRSEDSGESWTVMNPGGTYDNDCYVWKFDDLLVTPEDSSVYAYTDWADGMGGSVSHVCLSNDNGATWDYMDDGLYDHHAWDLVWIYPEIVGACTKDGLYIHPHGGKSWFRVPNEVSGLNCIDLAPGPTNNIWYLVESDYASSEEPDIVYMSTNYGLSWSTLSVVDDSCDIIEVAANPHYSAGSETILVGTWELGVFRSTDLGETWDLRNNGFSGVHCLSLAFGPAGSGLLYAGADMIFGAGLYRSHDMGKTWDLANDGLPPFRIRSICAHPVDEQIVFASCNGIYRSTNQGDSWVRLNNGLNGSGNVFCLVITPDGTVFAGADNGVYKSNDNGDSWTFSGLEGGSIKDLSFDSLNPAHMFAASYVPGGIYESLDNGENWTLVLSNVNIWDDFVSVAVAPGGEHVYAGMLWSDEFYRSTDGGDNWDIVLNQEAEAIIVPDNLPMAVACGGSHTDVWISLNGGDEWFTFPGGLADLDVLDLGVSTAGEGLLYAATNAGIQQLIAK